MTVNRYKDILDSLPKGDFYTSIGEILPYRDSPQTFEFTGIADDTYQITLNDIEQGLYVADGNGKIVFNTERELQPGDYEIHFINVAGNSNISTPVESIGYFSVRHYATIAAAFAQVFEEQDTEIDKLAAAQSILTVTEEYIEDTYGKRVRQPFSSTWLLETYRKVVQQLRPSYRHFGSHREGLNQVVASITSVNPFVVPDAWLRHWVLGDDLLDNGSLQKYTRLAAAPYQPQAFEVLNRQSGVYIHPKLESTVAITTGFRQPPEPQKIIVKNYTGIAYLVVEGLDPVGNAVTEVIPDLAITPVTGTWYRSSTIFSGITSLLSTTGAPLAVGLDTNKYIQITHVGDYLNDSSVTFQYEDNKTLTLRNGANTVAGESESYAGKVSDDGTSPLSADIDTKEITLTLHDINRSAYLQGARVTTTDSFSLDSSATGKLACFYNRLYPTVTPNTNEVNVVYLEGGTPHVAVASISPAATVALLNTANVPSAVVTAGSRKLLTTIIPDPFLVDSTEAQSEIIYGPGVGDASTLLFGPWSSSIVDSVSGNTIFTVDNTRLPAKDYRVRVNGVLGYDISGTLTVSTPTNIAIISSVSGWVATAADVGKYFRVVSNDGNYGYHKIIAYSGGNYTIQHEFASSGGVFTTTSVASCGMWHPEGEIAHVAHKDTNSLVCLEPLTYTWPKGAIIDVLDSVPLSAKSYKGVGEMDATIVHAYRPFHDKGDSLAFSGSTGTLICSRADFPGVHSPAYTVTLTNCTNSANNGTFDILSRIIDPDTGAYVSLTFTNVNGVNETSDFTWTVNFAVTTQYLTDTVEIRDASLDVHPDGWKPNGTTNGLNQVFDVTTQVKGTLCLSPLYTEGTTIETECLRALDFKGLPLTALFWVKEYATGPTTYHIAVEFTKTAPTTYVIGSTSVSIKNAGQPGSEYPSLVTGTFFVPYNATTVVIRLVREGTSHPFLVEKASLKALTTSFTPDLDEAGLVETSAGNSAVIFDAKRTNFGKLLYIWSADVLNADELSYLGLPNPVTYGGTLVSPQSATNLPSIVPYSQRGHVDYITNSHGYWERFNISELDDSGSAIARRNIRGTYDDVDFYHLEFNNLLSNLSLFIGTPPRMTCLVPSRASTRKAELLIMTAGGGGTGVAILQFNSNHDGSYPQLPNKFSQLYELKATNYSVTNGNRTTVIPAGTPIPVPRTTDAVGVQPWTFTAANQVTINAAYFDSTSSYTLDYEALTRITTDKIRLQSGSTNIADYVWMIDASVWLRTTIESINQPRIQQLLFAGDLTAKLTQTADTAIGAVLIKNNGKLIETVPDVEWNYIDNKTIQLTSTFDTSSVYTFEYTANTARIVQPVEYIVEWRSADTSDNVSSAPWIQVTNNQINSPVFTDSSDITLNIPDPWHQLRITLTGVTDREDARILGLGIKGIRLFCSPPYAPGLV